MDRLHLQNMAWIKKDWKDLQLKVEVLTGSWTKHFGCIVQP